MWQREQEGSQHMLAFFFLWLEFPGVAMLLSRGPQSERRRRVLSKFACVLAMTDLHCQSMGPS